MNVAICIQKWMSVNRLFHMFKPLQNFTRTYNIRKINKTWFEIVALNLFRNFRTLFNQKLSKATENLCRIWLRCKHALVKWNVFWKKMYTSYFLRLFFVFFSFSRLIRNQGRIPHCRILQINCHIGLRRKFCEVSIRRLRTEVFNKSISITFILYVSYL